MTTTDRPVAASPTEVTETNGRRSGRARRPRPGAVVGIVACTLGIAVLVWLFVRDESRDEASAASEPTTTTAEVVRRDLVETESFDGTLAFTGNRPVAYLRSGASSGDSTGGSTDTPASYESESAGSGASTAVAITYRASPASGRALAAQGSTKPPEGETGVTGETTTEPTPTEPTPTEPTPTEPTPTEPTPTEPTPTEPTPTEPTPTEPTPTEPTPTEPTPTEPTPTEPTPTEPTPTEPTPTEPTPTEPTPTEPTGTPPASGGSGTAATATDSTDSDGSGATSGEASVVTWLPEGGAALRRGDVLFRVSGRPTVLMSGDVPAWRTLEMGVEMGDDVLELERNLVALGYDPKGKIDVDRRFGAKTKAAVKRWQRDLGVDDTGVVELGSVAFLPGRRRVGSLDVAVGDQVQTGQAILTTTARRQLVTLDLDTTDQELLAEGVSVTVELPDGTEAPGTVLSIGTVASADESAEEQPGGGDSGSTATVEVTIGLDGEVDVELDEAPVDVEVASESRTGVLAVPVTALVALLGGGYALEVVDGPSTRLVAVEPGLYADGYVEIEGDDVSEGMAVVVPQ